jgi:hypothetical protein
MGNSHYPEVDDSALHAKLRGLALAASAVRLTDEPSGLDLATPQSPPLTLRLGLGCFLLCLKSTRPGRALGYFYFEEEPSRRAAAKLLTKDKHGASPPTWPSCRSCFVSPTSPPNSCMSGASRRGRSAAVARTRDNLVRVNYHRHLRASDEGKSEKGKGGEHENLFHGRIPSFTV